MNSKSSPGGSQIPCSPSSHVLGIVKFFVSEMFIIASSLSPAERNPWKKFARSMFRGERTCKNNAWKIFSFGSGRKAKWNLVICSHFCRDSASFLINTESFRCCQTTTIHAINKIVKVISLKRFVCHLISLMAKVSCWKLWKIREFFGEFTVERVDLSLITFWFRPTTAKRAWNCFERVIKKIAARGKTNRTLPAFPKSLAKTCLWLIAKMPFCGVFFLSSFRLAK